MFYLFKESSSFECKTFDTELQRAFPAALPQMCMRQLCKSV